MAAKHSKAQIVLLDYNDDLEYADELTAWTRASGERS
jgi:hypothetical protein